MHSTRMRLRTEGTLFALVLTAVLLGPRPGAAQVRVLVVDSLSGLPVPGASVQLLDPEGLILTGALSSQSGYAVLQNQDLGSTIRVRAFGYETWTGPMTDRPIARLVPDALRVDSLVVEVDSRSGLSQYRRRSQEFTGIFMDPAEVYLKSKYGVIEVFRFLREEGVRLFPTGSTRELRPREHNSPGGSLQGIRSNLGSGCLNVRLNNRPVRRPRWDRYPLDGLLPKDIMAVEIYRHFGEVPPELRANAGIGITPCGLIVIWTTEAWSGGS